MTALKTGEYIVQKGPLAVVYSCPICKKACYTFRKGRNSGRGAGLASSCTGRAAVQNHIKENHKES